MQLLLSSVCQGAWAGQVPVLHVLIGTCLRQRPREHCKRKQEHCSSTKALSSAGRQHALGPAYQQPATPPCRLQLPRGGAAAAAGGQAQCQHVGPAGGKC